MVKNEDMTKLEKIGIFSFERVPHPTEPNSIAWVIRCGDKVSAPVENLILAIELFARKVLQVEIKPFEEMPERGFWFARFPDGYLSPAMPLAQLTKELEEMHITPVSNPNQYIKTGVDSNPSEPVSENKTVTTNSNNMGNMNNIIDMFDIAHQFKDFPKISINDEQGNPVEMRLAGQKSSCPGTVTVTNGGQYGDPSNIYYGRITREGKFLAGKNCPTSIIDFLLRFNDDPAAIANAHGKMYNFCCFCGKTLTSEESLIAGYGPICAEHFGLPYGK